MKRTFVLSSLLALSSIASSGAGSSVSGSSATFVVDTRPAMLVEDVSSDYCSGAYAGHGGTPATFLAGVRCDIEFTIRASGRDGNAIDHYLVNGERQDDKTFTFDVGSLSAGGRLTVVAVDGQGLQSEPFRVNMNIATPPPLWSVAGRLSANVVADRDSQRKCVLYRASEFRGFSLFDAFSDALEVAGEDMPLELTPTVSLYQTMESDVGQFLVGSDIGGSMGSYGRNPNVIGRFSGLSITSSLSGGETYSYDPVHMAWRRGNIQLGIKLDGSWKVRQRIPQCPLIYGEIGLTSSASIIATEDEGVWYSDISLDPLIALKATIGAGIDVVAEAEASGQGGVHLDAKLPGGLESVFLRGQFMWRAVLFGFERSGVWWQADYSVYPRAQNAVNANHLFATGFRTAATSGMGGGFSPIPRNYGDGITRSMRRVAASGLLAAPAAPSGTQTLMHDGYPTPQPSLAVGGAKAALAYVRDNAKRTMLNRTEIVFREEASDGSWSDETHVWDDETADFQPRLVLLPAGPAVAAWVNAKRSFAQDASFETFCSSLELAVGVRNPQTGAWTCANLTDDAAFDGSPVLKGAANGTAAVVWVRNASGAYVGSSEQPSDLAVSFYRNGAWSAKQIAATGIGAVLSHDVAWNGDQAVVVWARDADGNLATDDAEIWAKTFSKGSWSAAVRLSSSAAGAMRPYVWFLPDGTPHVIWTQNGALMAANGLDGANAANVAVATDVSVPADFRIAERGDGSATLLWTTDPANSESGVEGSILSADYAPSTGLAASASLLRSEAILRNLSGTVDDGGTFRVAYEAVAVSSNSEGQLVRGAVDLAVTSREAVRDVGVTADDCSFARELAVGATNDLLIGIQNYGTAASGPFAYRVWEGEGEGKILLKSDELTIPPLSREVVKVPWTPREGLLDVVFTVEVDPENAIGDSNRENNALVWRPDVGLPRLSIRKATAVKATDTLRLITARIHNDGVAPVPAGTVVKFWRGDIGGELIGTDTAGVVSGGTAGEYDVGVAWDVSNVSFSSAWEQIVVELPAEAGGDRIAVWTDTPLYNSDDDPAGPTSKQVASVVEVIGETGQPAYAMSLTTGGKAFVVGESWFAQSGISTSGGVTPALMNGIGRNGLPRYQSFLFGLEPESETPAESQLKALISFDADGTPVISCSPKRESPLVIYKTFGKPTLDASRWDEVTSDNKASMRFFKVKVDLQ